MEVVKASVIPTRVPPPLVGGVVPDRRRTITPAKSPVAGFVQLSVTWLYVRFDVVTAFTTPGGVVSAAAA